MLKPSNYSLAPYSGKLPSDDLLHLLRRCLFGVGHKELQAFSGKTIEEAMRLLLQQSPLPEPPLQDDPDREDPLVPNGQPWINAPYEDEFIDKSRRDALKGWIAGQILERDLSITEKMKLFWRNHLVTEADVVNDARYSYTYSQLLHLHALGNFKRLVAEASVNPAMLVYLNGNTNHKNAPNENYARELLELFTLGKGSGVSYSEEDVRAAARVFTGWKDNKTTIQAELHPELHDEEDKKFSAYFNHRVVKGQSGLNAQAEIDDLLQMVFEQKATALYFCRNLYRWFVYPDIDLTTEQKIIAPLAEQFIAANFEVRPILRTLLSSQHFFDPAFRGAMVKSPVDFFLGAALQFDLGFPASRSDTFLNYIYFYFTSLSMLMAVADPPSVSGWPAYYQPPKFGLWWINSHTLGQRKAISDGLSSAKGVSFNGPVLKFDFLKFVAQLPQPSEVDALVQDSLRLLCPLAISEPQTERLKQLLLSGDIKQKNQWQSIWLEYTAQPINATAKTALETGLRAFFKKVMVLPEYQMM
jgi:uncharacterized protein (DUF1800 family)